MKKLAEKLVRKSVSNNIQLGEQLISPMLSITDNAIKSVRGDSDKFINTLTKTAKRNSSTLSINILEEILIESGKYSLTFAGIFSVNDISTITSELSALLKVALDSKSVTSYEKSFILLYKVDESHPNTLIFKIRSYK